MKGYVPVEIVPTRGGRLITRASLENVGLFDYSVKREIRREWDIEVQREGHDYFWPSLQGAYALDPGNQPFPLEIDDPGPINLIHEVVRENGHRAIIVGTPTRLYRFATMDQGGVYVEDVFEEGIYEEYAADWLVIGRGFDPEGHRWEAINIGGYLFLNNGRDLPVTYRVQDPEVVPVYELREQGIAYVGTIAALDGVPFCMDIATIPDELHTLQFEHDGIRLSGSIFGTPILPDDEPGTSDIVEATADFFLADDVGRMLVFDDGTRGTIIAVLSPLQVQLDAEVTAPPQPFRLRTAMYQDGSYWSGEITADALEGSADVTASAAVFAPEMEGTTLRFVNGWTTVISLYVSPTVVVVADVAPAPVEGLPFWIVSDVPLPAPDLIGDFYVTADAPMFTPEHVGRTLFWDSGDSRRILEYLSPTQVRVDSDQNHESELGAIENVTSYDRWSGFVDRITYRAIWGSAHDNPRRWGVITPGTVNVGENRVSLRYPFKSFEAGQSVTVVGAGVAGGNISSVVVYVTDNRVLLTEDQMVTSVVDGLVQQSDVIGSIVGYEDLEHDGSAILRGMPLKGRLVIYKDSCAFVAKFTGNSSQPFVFQRIETPDGKNLYFRWTLINVNNEFHLYAGKTSFYRFDLVSMVPRESEAAELCKDLFFSQAKLAETNRIFTATNEIVGEVWLWFPSATEDKAMVYDSQFGTWSTSQRAMVAAATVKRPVEGGILAGESQHWYLMATEAGVLLQYGLATEAVASWGGATRIYYQRSDLGFPGTKQSYNWLLRSGLSDYGSRHGEKDIRAYVLHLASDSDDLPVAFELFGARNASEGVQTLATKTIVEPKAEPMISTFYRRHYLGWSLSGGTIDKAVRIAGQTMEVSGVLSQSFVRRVA